MGKTEKRADVSAAMPHHHPLPSAPENLNYRKTALSQTRRKKKEEMGGNGE